MTLSIILNLNLLIIPYLNIESGFIAKNKTNISDKTS